MKQETYFIAFSTQKGGVGKTTFTVLVSSYLHYVKGYDVAVIDCDYPQYSISQMRKRDLDMVFESKDDYYKKMIYKQLNKLGKKCYPIIESNPKDAIADASQLFSSGDFDFIFFDLPGTIDNKDIVHTLAHMHYIVAPMSADLVVVESTLNYGVTIKENLVGKRNLKDLYLLWNMVDAREKTGLYIVYEKVIADLELTVLKTFLPDSKRFRRELSENHRALFRSTLFPVDKSLLKGSNIDLLVNELLDLFK